MKPVIQYTWCLCHRLQKGLQEYAEYVKARNNDSNNLLVYDPRSPAERLAAEDLQTLATAAAQVAKQDVPPEGVEGHATKIDGKLYCLPVFYKV